MLFNFSFWYRYEIFLYNIQQKIAFFLSLEISFIKPIMVLVLFCSGILTSLNPCFINIFPLSLSYISSNKSSYTYKNMFILGISTSLFIIIVFTSFLNYGFFIFFNKIPFMSSFILVLIALDLLQIINIIHYFNIFYFNNYNMKKSKNNLLLNNYLVGCMIGFTIVPCSSPIILFVNFLLHHTGYIFIYFFYLFIYLLGCIITLIFIFNIILNYLQFYFISYFWSNILPFMACFLLSMSTFYVLDKLFI